MYKRVNDDAENKKTPKAWTLEAEKAAFMRCITLGLKNGMEPAEIRKMFATCISEVAAPTAVAHKKAA